MQSILYVLDFIFFLTMISFLVLTSNYKKQLRKFNSATKLNGVVKFRSEKKIIVCRVLWIISLIIFLIITGILFWNLSANINLNY